MEETPLGKVVHFFPRPMVAAVAVEEGSLTVGEAIHFLGGVTDLHHRVRSMQVEHADVGRAEAGDVVGIRVPARVREKDRVLKVKEDGS